MLVGWFATGKMKCDLTEIVIPDNSEVFQRVE